MWFAALPGRTKVGPTHKEFTCEKVIDISTEFPVYIWIRINFPTNTGAWLKWLYVEILCTPLHIKAQLLLRSESCVEVWKTSRRKQS